MRLFSLLLCAAALAAGQEPVAISTGPYLQNPAPESATVMWLTNRNAAGWVEYGSEGLTRRATASRHGLMDANRIHRIVLTGLKPGAKTQYRACSREIVAFEPYKVEYGATVCSQAAELRTPDRAAPLSFLVFNDIHETSSVMPDMLAAAGTTPYDLVVFNGDILSHIGSERQITGILDDATRLFASRIPLVWVRGNHETRGSFARRLPEYIGLRQEHYYYSFDYGPVHFVVLDAGEDKPDKNPEYSGLVDFDAYRREEAQWLREEIRTEAFRQAAFRIVIVHMPFPEAAPYAAIPPIGMAAEGHGMVDAYRQFGGLLNEGRVDLMISAHLHAHKIVPPVPGQHDYPIVRGGGPTEKNRTLIRVRAARDRLRAEILRPGGAVADALEIPSR